MPISRLFRSPISRIFVSLLMLSATLRPAAALAATVDKSETVHVDISATGEVAAMRVDDLLTNDDGSRELVDRSTLGNLEPNDDAVSYRTNEDGTLIWSTDGTDVSYRGTSSEQPPVNLDISYHLDGRPLAADQLAGVTGHLVMRIDYRNTLSSTVRIKDADETIYTPFLCMTVAMLDSNVFSNVQVTNGKAIEDKGGIAVIEYAVPGLSESLALDPDEIDLDLPEYLQIEADVRDLQLDPIHTIVTPELFSDLDADDLSFDELGGDTSELTDAMNELVDGSGSLADALHLLGEGSGQLGGGAQALRDALSSMPYGVCSLAQGAKQLSEGLDGAHAAADSLATAANKLSAYADAAAGEAGIGAVQALVGQASAQVGVAQTALSGEDGLKSAIDAYDIDGAQATVGDATTAARDAQAMLEQAQTSLAEATPTVTIPDTVTDGLDTTITALEGIDVSGMDESSALAVQEALASAQQARDGLVGVSASNEPVDLTGVPEAIGDLESAGTSLGSLSDELDTVRDRADEAAEAVDSAAGLLAGTQQGCDAATGAVLGLGQAADKLAGGISSVASGLSGASDGARGLYAGLNQLGNAAPQAVEGANALADGANQLTGALSAVATGSDALSDGLSTFNREGITKIVDSLDEFDGDLDRLGDRINALRDAAQGYDNFSGKAEGQSSSVRFIYKTEQIG